MHDNSVEAAVVQAIISRYASLFERSQEYQSQTSLENGYIGLLKLPDLIVSAYSN